MKKDLFLSYIKNGNDNEYLFLIRGNGSNLVDYFIDKLTANLEVMDIHLQKCAKHSNGKQKNFIRERKNGEKCFSAKFCVLTEDPETALINIIELFIHDTQIRVKKTEDPAYVVKV